jgi:rubrerythrin
MHENILKKIERRVDRRSFLRGSSLAAAAIVGVAVFPLMSAAQDAAPQASGPKDAQDAKPGDKAPDQGKDQGKDDKKDEKKKDEKTAKKEEPDPFKETKKDSAGRDYRVCPQCGYNMYKQDRTWTCENCGFSYTE